MTEDDRSGAATPLVPGRLYVLGAEVALDGRITWAPAQIRGWQRINSYLLIGESRSLLINTGPHLHETQVIQQLNSILPPGSTLSIFLPRSFGLDVVGNVKAVSASYQVDELIQGGPPTLWKAFGLGDGITGSKRPKHRPPGEEIRLGPDRRLEILTPALRILTTYWSFDEGTGTLFTSDVFGHTCSPTPEQRPVLDEASDDITLETVSAFNLAKFWFLDRSYTYPMIANLEQIFATHDVQRIAPDHGAVIEGEKLVATHVDLMRQSLANAEAAWAS